MIQSTRPGSLLVVLLFLIGCSLSPFAAEPEREYLPGALLVTLAEDALLEIPFDDTPMAQLSATFRDVGLRKMCGTGFFVSTLN